MCTQRLWRHSLVNVWETLASRVKSPLWHLKQSPARVWLPAKFE